MSQEHVRDELSAYLDGALQAPARTRVDRHLEVCATCRQDLDNLRALETDLSRLVPPDPGGSYWSRFAPRVEDRLHRTVPAQAPVAVGQRLRGWFFPQGSWSWPRRAGAVAAIGLLVFVGVRSFRPSELEVRSPTTAPRLESHAPLEPAGVAEDKVESQTESDSPEIAPAPAPQTQDLDMHFDVRAKENRPARLAQEKTLPLPKQGISIQNPSAEVDLVGADERARAEEIVSRFIVGAVQENRNATEAAFSELESTGFPGLARETRDRMVVWLRAGREQSSGALQSDQGDRARPAFRELAQTPPAPAQPADVGLEALLALDELVWPRRDDLALRGALEAVAQELARRAEVNEKARTRARVYLEWLVQHTATDQVETWQELLRPLSP